MTEYDFRPECENCRGSGGIVTPCPPLSAKILEMSRTGGYIVICYKCEGSGRGPYTETVELEERK